MNRDLSLLISGVLALACATAQPALAQSDLTVEEAHKRMPRADLSGLSGEQLKTLWEVATDSFPYTGCQSTLAACLGEGNSNKHPVRMARLAAQLIRDGFSNTQTIYFMEQYYGTFDKSKRVSLRTDDAACLGDPKAPITMVEFSDYQCPHCAAALKPLADLAEGNKKIRFCSKYFPLPGHPRAGIAAAAAEYARAHGKFWQLHDLLFKFQDELEDANLKSYAKQVGLDGDAMLKEVYGHKHDALIAAHTKEGVAAGVKATPTVFFNGRAHALPVKPEYLELSAEDELEWQKNGGAWDKD